MYLLLRRIKLRTATNVCLVRNQEGFALVVVLILLLVITAMGVGITYLSNLQSDMVESVINKPMSIEAAETCFDKAIEWLETSNGRKWLNGKGSIKDLVLDRELVDNNMLLDTLQINKGVDQKFTDGIARASFEQCSVEKTNTEINGNTGNEIGTSNGYGASNYIYTIKITAVGWFDAGDAATGIWQSKTTKTTLEAIVKYAP